MFVEIEPNSYLNFAGSIVVQAHLGFISGGLGCGSSLTGNNVKIGSQVAAGAVLLELMRRFDEGRRVVFYQEFKQIVAEMNRLYPYASEG